MSKDLLQGKVALVTGGTAGIGKAIVEVFVSQGAHVAFFGTNVERGKAVVNTLLEKAAPGQKIAFIAVDVSDAVSVKNGIEKCRQEVGEPEILVNNAGITRDGLLMKMSEEEWDCVFDVNLKAVYRLCKAFVRPMMKARKGKIINIASIVGLTGAAGQTNYAASKAGLIGFSKSLAQEVASRNICVNCVAPGFIKTQMSDLIPEQLKEKYLKQIPLGKVGQTDDVANAVLFLASDMANYITGQTLTVDGGMVM
ncbi:3-oxoacyl-ACP reductase FabG [Simkania negevensis]|uniref:3-oxoacyl-[acyl-carrier-protein] reductase n=1 Tax=Simkania negevensis TaxID=83561 RepID=A0ABS3ATL2_9BACT|nr:3-oxoacyl-ACP reductase FabG [Simkania negevensis]